MADLKQQLEEARSARSPSASAASSPLSAAAGASAAGAADPSVIDEHAATQSVIHALDLGGGSDGQRPLKRARKSRGGSGSGSSSSSDSDGDAASDPSTAPASPVSLPSAVEQLLTVWTHNTSAAQRALQALEKASAPSVAAQFVQWLMTADSNQSNGIWQRVFVQVCTSPVLSVFGPFPLLLTTRVCTLCVSRRWV